MVARSRSIQVVASVLAAVLLVVPAGTSLALCLSAGSGPLSGDHSPDEVPSSKQVVVSSQPHHHCSGEMLDLDMNPALQLEERSSRWIKGASLFQGASPASAPLSPPNGPSVQSRTPPEARRPLAVSPSLRTVVLLV